MSLKIYKVACEYQAIMQQLYDNGHDEKTINDTLDSLNMREDLEEKAISLAAFIKNMELEAEALQKAIDDLVGREDVLLKKIQRNKDYLRYVMVECNVRKITSPELTIRVCKNNPKVKINNIMAIPSEYYRIEQDIRLETDKIKKALKQGATVPGCELVQDQRLEIK